MLAEDSTVPPQPPTPNTQQPTAWQFNNLDGTKFVNSKGWFPSDYAFAGQKLQSASSDFLVQSRDASRSVWGGGIAGSTVAAGTGAFLGSIGSSFYRVGNGIAQLGANAIDTAMIGVNAGTTYAGSDWQYRAIGSLGAAVERGEVTTGDIAWGVANGLGTAVADIATLGGYASYQYANGQISAEEAGDRFLGLGLSALGGAGALRAAGLGNLTVAQAAAATGRTAARTARAVGNAAANAGRAVAQIVQQLEVNPGALAQFNSGVPVNLMRWKSAGDPMATVAEGYGMALESKRLAPSRATTSIGDIRRTGQRDAHHVIQDAAVRDLPGYNTNAAPGVRLDGPANVPGTLHNLTRPVQRELRGGTYGAERRIGYEALRKAGKTPEEARQLIEEADDYFRSIGVGRTTPTRIPGDRR